VFQTNSREVEVYHQPLLHQTPPVSDELS